MVDQNVSFTDVGEQQNNTQGANGGGGSSAMLDLLGDLNKEKEKEKGKKGGKKDKKEKKGKAKTKKVRKADKFESQNFLYRIEGAIFCAAIITGFIVLVVFIIVAIVFGVITNGQLVSYIQ
uniref:Uncharacterized protein n=1 Tax=Caenorhabditis japonica TaxID=281687 RepID=A0A8R1I9D8_CAEJA